MRAPPDKGGQPAPSDRDIESSNATLNTLFGGARQKSWMVGAGAPVRPTPRTSTSRPSVPQVASVQRHVLQSPTQNDGGQGPSGSSRNAYQSERQFDDENQRSLTINQPVPRNDLPGELLAASQDIAAPTDSQNQAVQNSSPNQDTRTTDTRAVADSLQQYTAPNEVDMPPLPSSVLLPSEGPQQLSISPQSMSPALQQQQSPSLPQVQGSRRVIPGPGPGPAELQQAGSIPEAGHPRTQYSNTFQPQIESPNLSTQSNHNDMTVPRVDTSCLSTQINYSNIFVPRLDSPNQLAQISPRPNTNTLPVNSPDGRTPAPHKRQRKSVPMMPSLAGRVHLIDRHIATVGGIMNLNSGLERPRYQLLRDACLAEDAFYVALHQIFCLWNLDQSQILGVQGLPDLSSLTWGFNAVGHLIRDNSQLAPIHRNWFAQFPTPLGDLLRTSEPYRMTIADVGACLEKLATGWPELAADCEKRKYPPLVDELVIRLGLLSPVLQRVVFAATRRNLGFADELAGAQMDDIFKRDQYEHQNLANRMDTSRPPTAREIAERNQALISEYMTMFHNFVRGRRSSGAVTGSPSSRISTPVLPSNAASNGPSPNPNFTRPQQSSNQPGRHQIMGSPEIAGNWHVPIQTHPNSRPNMASPNPSMTAPRRPSAGANHSNTNTPSPTLLQGLTMHSPVQQTFQPQQILRSNSGHAQSGQASTFIPNIFVPQISPHANGQSQSGQASTFVPNMNLAQNPPRANGQAQSGQASTFVPNIFVPQLSPHANGPAAQQRAQSVARQNQQAANQQGQWPQSMQNSQSQLMSQQPSHQMLQQQAFMQQSQMQQVLNMNRAAQLRRNSNGVIDPQQRVASRNSGVSGGGRGTPGSNPNPTFFHRSGVPRNPSRAQNEIAAYANSPPLQRSFVPPLGYQHPTQTKDPEVVALHQVHLRSPMLLPVDAPKPQLGQENNPDDRYYQVVRGFALPPTRITSSQALTKYDFNVPNGDIALIPLDTSTGIGHPGTRYFKQGSLLYRLRCIQLPRSDLDCPISKWVVSDTVWPDSASLTINSHHLEIRRKNHHQKDLPIDLTSYVRVAGSKGCHIQMSIIRNRIKLKESNYLLAVEVVEILQHRQIINACQKHRIPANVTLDKIKKSLAGPTDDEDDDFAMVISDLSVGLADPFTARIFDTPVRGSSCLHRECFDLETFLLTRNSKPKRPEQPSMVDVWKCPLCSKDARPFELRIDDFFASVRSGLAEQGRLDCRTILISADGSWRPKVEKRKATADPDSDESSDEDRSSKKKAIAAKGKKVVEVIDLDD